MINLKEKLISFEKNLTQIVYLICATEIIIATILIFGITIGRYFFGTSWEWAEELIRYLIICAALFGSAPMVFNESHISMDVVATRFSSPKVIYVYKLICAFSALVISFLLFIWGNKLVSTSKMMSYSLIFKMKYVYAIIPVSMALILLYSILKIATVLFEGINKTGEVSE